MLRSKNLDDQTFEEIMELVLGRVPWIAPEWTDHNAHDPGITILELMAWYKEMQQFHLNMVTDSMRGKLLKLLGLRPEPEKAARCFIDAAGFGRRELARLETPEGTPFELLSAIEGSAVLAAVFAEDNATGRVTDVTGMLGQPEISLMPFAYGGAETSLLIGFETDDRLTSLDLWFDITEDRAVTRNPFMDDRQQPRVIEWSFVGSGVVTPLKDDTHALSASGYVSLEVPPAWRKSKVGDKELKFIRLHLTDPGCEEIVRMRTVSASMHEVSQQETWSNLRGFTFGNHSGAEVRLEDELSNDGMVYVFIRTGSDKLRQVEYEELRDDAPSVLGKARGRIILVDASEAVVDGQENLFVVSIDQMRIQELIYPSTGLPNMEVQLPLGGRTVLTERIGLICDTLDDDGEIRPTIWRYTEDLRACSPEDRVFSFDSSRECLVFGDGGHGSIVPRGEGAILITPLVLSYCGAGNAPEGRMNFVSDGIEARNTAAYGGAAAQTMGEAGRAFLLKLEKSGTCASERDYERAALGTPGLRVAAARAVAGYDPDEPTGVSRIPVVTVIAVPYSSAERPMPDKRFIETVRRYIETLRPICTQVKVIAPRYAPIGFTAQVRADTPNVEEKLRAAAADYMRLSKTRAIGDSVVRNDLAARLMKIEGVYKIERLELRQLGSDCYMTTAGDIQIPRNAVPYLEDADIVIK